jgi:hypothetical protein
MAAARGSTIPSRSSSRAMLAFNDRATFAKHDTAHVRWPPRAHLTERL